MFLLREIDYVLTQIVLIVLYLQHGCHETLYGGSPVTYRKKKNSCTPFLYFTENNIISQICKTVDHLTQIHSLYLHVVIPDKTLLRYTFQYLRFSCYFLTL